MWFDIGKFMWKKYHSVYDNNVRYVQNDITKYFSMHMLNYEKYMHEMFELAIFLHPT